MADYTSDWRIAVSLCGMGDDDDGDFGRAC